MLGAIFSGKDFRDYKAVCATTASDLPKEFELKFFTNYVAKSQGMVGSCVAHALSEVIEYYDNTQNGNNLAMSTGYIYGNRNTSLLKDEGMIIRDALNAVRMYGDVYEYEFPYNVEVPKAIELFQENADRLYDKGYMNRISNYCRLNNEDEIKSVLIEGKPVVMAIKWYRDMKVVNEILTTSKQRYSGGHCMLIYGWDERGWKILNSHGKYWGKNGKCILPYDYKLKEAWAVIDNIIGTKIEIKKPFSSKIGKIFALLLNKILQLFNK